MSDGDPQIDFTGKSHGITSFSSSNSQGDTAEELAKHLDKIKNYIAELKAQLLGPEQQDSFQDKE